MQDSVRPPVGRQGICRRPSGQHCHSATPAGMQKILDVIARFCQWSGMRVKMTKSVSTAFDYGRRTELPTNGIRYSGEILACQHAKASDISDQDGTIGGAQGSEPQYGGRDSACPVLHQGADSLAGAIARSGGGTGPGRVRTGRQQSCGGGRPSGPFAGWGSSGERGAVGPSTRGPPVRAGSGHVPATSGPVCLSRLVRVCPHVRPFRP